jgi:DNA-binding NarL/FixJ family response regulator
MEPIRIAIVEDLSHIRDGLKFLVNQTPGLANVGTFDTAEEALAGLEALAPDIVIMDISLGGMSGIECIRRIKAAGSPMQFMIFTVYEDSDQVFEALSSGASGYLLKNSPPEKIVEALRELHAGGAPMSTSIARKVVFSFQRPSASQVLSARETEVLGLLGKGYLYKEIAADLGLSTGTVRQHIHNIYEKLHVQNRTEALNKVFGRGQ